LILRRVAAMGFSILFLTALIFVLMQAVFGDPVVIMLGRDADPDTVARLRRDLGLERPVHVQYADWLGRLAQGDWGRSFRTGQPVLGAIAVRLPLSLELALLSLLLAVLVALALGTLAAVRPGTPADVGISLLTAFGTAMPNFWIAILLILLFALHLRVLPSSGSVPFLDDPLGHARAMLLPTITLSFAYVCNLTRLVRARMLEALETDYVRTARAKGLAERITIVKHVVRNALIPVVTLVALQVPTIFAGALITEQIFRVPGIGSLLISSILANDTPVIMAITFVFSALVVLFNLVADILYGWLDPRIAYR
jgi:peptide/nickel transport system permease protein